MLYFACDGFYCTLYKTSIGRYKMSLIAAILVFLIVSHVVLTFSLTFLGVAVECVSCKKKKKLLYSNKTIL